MIASKSTKRYQLRLLQLFIIQSVDQKTETSFGRFYLLSTLLLKQKGTANALCFTSLLILALINVFYFLRMKRIVELIDLNKL